MVKSPIEEIEKIELDLLLDAIYRCYGYDFRGYALPFIQRRVHHRLRNEKLPSISALQEKILHDPTVMQNLFCDFSINVTEMFRDPSFFKALRTKVLPKIKDKSTIRIWHIGSSTGEEVYSMSILLHEEGLYEKAKIYATDINEENIKKAKKGVFSIDGMQQYTQNYFEAGGKRSFSEYYKAIGEQVIFRPYLQTNVIFAQHNLVTDHSINEFDIIICRNVLIYFNKELQNKVHQLLYESLCLEGYIGLGKREGIKFTSYGNRYEEFDATEKLYRKYR
ncbi:chemotaxis protein CheR [Halalkalibacter okhensis]|uniref:Chemotaxis protein CheR n=1 Tax=Halalkalibacter okhensis TaxID=333138 RepID=A0A0B0IDL8_9BACI|nr:chemotaxis protein CheR [Halalkalibacter okhensis]